MGDDPLFDDDTPEAHQPQPKGPWRPRFGIGSIMLATFLLSVLFVMGHYMLNDSKEGVLSNRFSFMFVTLAAPMLLLTILSIGKELLRYWEKQSQRKNRNSAD
ncbi:hypothetical protein C5Y96_13515 [Blastopirellula marina]|uniref:Uncharacterized protein n=1 Tax=Blastopirellula marina TaxID=124 RepID=A0A2S8FGS7_9BACT|nr:MULTISPECIES: hypothetical protein [Pirellulaceae]PQO31353.1 hypothetical protein C5Y96_13515 [Blastopirellula marina]RCS51747.1 hypothetical protein DTL36_13525 [Bremerella cremea]